MSELFGTDDRVRVRVSSALANRHPDVEFRGATGTVVRLVVVDEDRPAMVVVELDGMGGERRTYAPEALEYE